MKWRLSVTLEINKINKTQTTTEPPHPDLDSMVERAEVGPIGFVPQEGIDDRRRQP